MPAVDGWSVSTPLDAESAPAIAHDVGSDERLNAIDGDQSSTLSRLFNVLFVLGMAGLLLMFVYHFATTDINPRQGLYQRWGDLYGPLFNPVPGPQK